MYPSSWLLQPQDKPEVARRGGGAGIRMLCARNTSVAMPIDDESESEIEGGGGEGEN